MSAWNLIPENDYVDTCMAIRERTGDADLIRSGDLAAKIRSIPGPKPEEERSIMVTENGTTYVEPTPGSVMTKVTVETEVAGKAPALQAKTVTPTKAQQPVEPDAGFDALSKVTVNPIPDKYADVSGDTVTANDMVEGVTAHDKTGAQIEGSVMKQQAITRLGARAEMNGNLIRITGQDLPAPAFVPAGGTVILDTNPGIFGTAKANQVKKGATFTSSAGFEVKGTMEPPQPTLFQPKTVIPTKEQQLVRPDFSAGYAALSQVTVEPIPAQYPDVSGDTVTADKMLAGTTAHDKTGAAVEGALRPLGSSAIATGIDVVDSDGNAYPGLESVSQVVGSKATGPSWFTNRDLTPYDDGMGGVFYGWSHIFVRIPEWDGQPTIVVSRNAMPNGELGALVRIDDENFNPGNIRAGATVFGMPGSAPGPKPEEEKTVEIKANGTTVVTPTDGKTLKSVTVTANIPTGGGGPTTITPGDTPVVSSWGAQQVTNTAAYQQVHSVAVPKAGTYRVRYIASKAGGGLGGGNVSAQLMVNGTAATGVAAVVPEVGGSSYSADLALQAGDTVTVGLKAAAGSWGGQTTPAVCLGVELCIDWAVSL